MKTLAARTALSVAALGLAVGGCSGEISVGNSPDDDRSSQGPGEAQDPETVDGEELSRLAEQTLQQDVSGLTPGTFNCPEIPLAEGAKVTCTRSTVVDAYYVKVDGTVELTEVDGEDVRIHVRMEDRAKEFGTTGDSIATDLATQAASHFGTTPSDIQCPDLPGENGAACSGSRAPGSSTPPSRS